MSVLAFKAISYGAEKIPDKFFEKIPGGFFTPEEKKKIDKKRSDNRRRSEERQHDRARRRSHRDRSPPTDYSDQSGYDDTDYDEYSSKQRRRRARSLGRSLSRSLSRGRHRDRSGTRDWDVEMDRVEHAPEFPPPPTSEYRSYTPQEYAPARPEYGYSPQVNTHTPLFRSATVGPVPPHSTAANTNSTSSSYPPLLTSSSPSYLSTSPLLLNSPTRYVLSSYSSPFQRAFSPSYEPPLAALLYRTATDSPQPLGPRASVSSSAAKYIPAAAYAQAPVASPAPQPIPAYAPYNPADYASPSPVNRAPVAYYPSPPPFYRQKSRSQPSLDQYPYPTHEPVAYLEAPSRHGSTASSHHRRHGDEKHHRTRSAGHHGRSRSRVTDKFRDRFENLDSHEKTLAASVGGALAGGLAGNALGHGALSTLVGAAIGGLGAREFEKKHEK